MQTLRAIVPRTDRPIFQVPMLIKFKNKTLHKAVKMSHKNRLTSDDMENVWSEYEFTTITPSTLQVGKQR